MMARSVYVAAIVAAALEIGCLGSGTTRATRMYVLDPTVPATSGSRSELAIGVGPTSLPERLDRPQILTRTGSQEVEIAEFEHWAEPLDKAFPRVLAENLANATGSDRVSVYPWSRSVPIDVQVEVSVSRFETEADGSVTLAARWRLIGPGRREILPTRASSYSETPASDSTADRVDALGRALGRLSRDVADAIRASH